VANGRLVPGPQTAASQGSVNLTGATISTPEASAAWQLQPVVGRGIKGAFVNPVQPALSRIGRDAPLHDQAWFDKIHILPRELDLGEIVSEEKIDVEVWNSFRNRAKLLTAINVTGSDGISTIPTGAFHFPATLSKVYTVVIAGEGDPIIDAILTWIFTGISSSGTNLHIVGFRLTPFSWPPNGGGGGGGDGGGDQGGSIEETFGYLTDIIVSQDGMEQRRQLRAVPVGSISYSTLFESLQDAQLANAVLYGNSAGVFGVPRWQFRSELVSAAAINDTILFCDPTNLPFEVGGLCFLWKSPTSWEAHAINSIASDRIVLNLPLRKAWPIGTAIYPMVRGRSPFGQAFRWETLTFGGMDVVFEVEGFRP